ncbi:MAG: hypothetical protein ACLFMX_00450 [Halobacteriales archaeon]
MASYYDAILALIPLAIAGLTGALFVAGFSLTHAVPLASTVAALLIGHAMFVRAPTDRFESPPGAVATDVSAD